LVRRIGSDDTERDHETEASLRAQRLRAEAEIDALGQKVVNEAPDYASLLGNRTTPAAQLRSSLAEDEAFLSFLVGKHHTFVFALTANAQRWHRIKGLGKRRLSERIAKLRKPFESDALLERQVLLPYDAHTAHELYRLLLQPVEELIGERHHLIIVKDGPLHSLPFNILLSAPPGSGAGPATVRYANMPWLVKRHAISNLPAVSALVALRNRVRPSKATNAFVGFGDPKIAASTEVVANGATHNPETIDTWKAVRQLPALPQTATELNEIARVLAGHNQHVFLRDRANERVVRSLDLDSFRIIAFATHGLLPGDLTNLTEPSLVLTPPSSPNESEDGLLTMSEIATLKLDAVWVVLSACNTAGAGLDLGSSRNAGLSGLAKAFFYAGTRALLISHWPVASVAAERLTTTVFTELAKDREMGRAEALRRSALALMNSSDGRLLSHPVFWAPFVMVGDGGHGRL
jgi:CHAT domain-containing protein